MHACDDCAGETGLSKEEAVEWCRNWANGKVYAMVGQNCWSMVYEFLTEHDGCEIPDEVACASSRSCMHVYSCARLASTDVTQISVSLVDRRSWVGIHNKSCSLWNSGVPSSQGFTNC